jgi:cysteinyl-tRNA synthetase
LKMEAIGKETFTRMKDTFLGFAENVLGLKHESNLDGQALVQVILNEYKEAKESRNFAKVDDLRAQLKAQGVVVKDMKDKIDWAFEE